MAAEAAFRTRHKMRVATERGDDPIDPNLPDYPSILHALDFAARNVPDRTAFVCEDVTLTFAELARAVGGLADRLASLGAGNTRVAVMMNNSADTAVTGLAAMAAGGQLASVNPNYTERELGVLLADTQPGLIVCIPDHEAKARAAAAKVPGCKVEIVVPGGVTIGRWTKDAGAALPKRLPGPSDRACIFFTGGTTGVPKGAEHVHGGLIAFCRQITELWPVQFDAERMLIVAPMFHIFGHHFSKLWPLYVRASVVIVPRYKPEIVLQELDRHRITVFPGGPPSIYFGLLANPDIEKTDFTALRFCLSGGAPCPEALLRRWEERTGAPICEGLGMSEGAPVTCSPVVGTRKLMSVGVVPPRTDIQIVDLETGTRVLPAGERGEIRVRGPQFTVGYCNRPDETAVAIRDGWLYTGDIGYFDAEGYLFVVDRKKELILVGGYNVYPREVDEVLHSHPAVHEAAAVGVPDDFKGEVVKAFVALKPGARLTEQELVAYCGERLAPYKVPVAVAILDALPKTGPAKIDKLALKGLRK
jgi:long-chain acyl-CoA synthetase